MTPQEIVSRYHEITARRDSLVASLAPQETAVAERVAVIEDLKAKLRPLVSDLNKKKAPLYAIDMERADIARRLSGKTGGGRTFPRTPRQGAEIIPFGPIGEDTSELSARLAHLEGTKDQTITAMETILKAVEIESQKRQRLEEVILTLAERAEDTLRTKG